MFVLKLLPDSHFLDQSISLLLSFNALFRYLFTHKSPLRFWIRDFVYF